jgi:hypothetical protein
MCAPLQTGGQARAPSTTFLLLQAQHLLHPFSNRPESRHFREPHKPCARSPNPHPFLDGDAFRGDDYPGARDRRRRRREGAAAGARRGSRAGPLWRALLLHPGRPLMRRHARLAAAPAAMSSGTVQVAEAWARQGWLPRPQEAGLAAGALQLMVARPWGHSSSQAAGRGAQALRAGAAAVKWQQGLSA